MAHFPLIMLDWDFFFKAFPVAMTLGNLMMIISVARRKDVDNQLSDVRASVDDVCQRMLAAEQTIRTMPGREDTHKLEMMLVEMGGDMKAMRATMRGMSESLSRTESIVSRHEDHLRGDK